MYFHLPHEILQVLLSHDKDEDLLKSYSNNVQTIEKLIGILLATLNPDKESKRKSFWKDVSNFIIKQAEMERNGNRIKLTMTRLIDLVVLVRLFVDYKQITNIKNDQTSNMLRAFLFKNIGDSQRKKFIDKIEKGI